MFYRYASNKAIATPPWPLAVNVHSSRLLFTHDRTEVTRIDVAVHPLTKWKPTAAKAQSGILSVNSLFTCVGAYVCVRACVCIRPFATGYGIQDGGWRKASRVRYFDFRRKSYFFLSVFSYSYGVIFSYYNDRWRTEKSLILVLNTRITTPTHRVIYGFDRRGMVRGRWSPDNAHSVAWLQPKCIS